MEEEGHPSSPPPSSSLVDPGERMPAGLTREEYDELKETIEGYHRYDAAPGQCSSLIAQRIHAPADTVWSVVRRFDRPQAYKHFIKSCRIVDHAGGEPPVFNVGCLREVTVISGLPANTSTEKLDLLDEDRRVAGFSIIGGEHRLRNYRSVTTVNEVAGKGGEIVTVALESYVVDVPEGNTEEDTRLFADTVVRLNLQQLASVSQAMAKPRKQEHP
ncbi:abscisic acid receptor PYR1-like [Nymphaea colorata]|uniref:Abscisic acid receptor PYR1 n=1 Tax=Nymphaea colorata TaxID=210225 RepID=A0A5K1CWP6_9MAGN|nr:abscisic acid receptor PYR1-like [Nymphaea colorata]